MNRFLQATLAAGVLLAATALSRAQQLEPRAYSPAPTGLNFAGVSYAHSSGDVLFDPTLPFTDVQARINMGILFYSRTFGLFGRSASVAAVLPYVWGTVDGNVGEDYRRADRSGIGDTTLRLSVNLLGGPALAPRAFAAAKHGTTLGASLVVTAPTGQYDGTKLINIGTNRWSIKPELGLAVPVGNWVFEGYFGVWLFTANDDFFVGKVRKQDPMPVGQLHVVYNFRPRLWIAADYTRYEGGSTTVDGVQNHDRQSNARAGFTMAVPMTRAQSLKFAYAKGVTSRIGSKIDTYAVAWQVMWM